MKKRDRDAWVKALRSGEYKQTQRRLCDGEGFCCLGVAYDVLVDGYWVKIPGGWGIQVDPSDSFAIWGVLPAWVLNQVGLSRYEVDNLVNLNDDMRMTFEEIAEWIEENISAGKAGA